MFEVKKNFILNIINHLNRRTIADCLYKILTSYIQNYKDNEIKIEIIKKVIDSFDLIKTISISLKQGLSNKDLTKLKSFCNVSSELWNK